MTIQQIQTAINDKTLDPRQLINLLADYIQANPGGGSSSYLVYTALLSQTGTNAPTVTSNGSGANTPLTNDVGETIWTRDDIGIYRATNALFIAGKTAVIVGTPSGNQNEAYWLNDNTNGYIRIVTTNEGVEEDQWLANTFIEIRVYL